MLAVQQPKLNINEYGGAENWFVNFLIKCNETCSKFASIQRMLRMAEFSIAKRILTLQTIFFSSYTEHPSWPFTRNSFQFTISNFNISAECCDEKCSGHPWLLRLIEMNRIVCLKSNEFTIISIRPKQRKALDFNTKLCLCCPNQFTVETSTSFLRTQKLQIHRTSSTPSVLDLLCYNPPGWIWQKQKNWYFW